MQPSSSSSSSPSPTRWNFDIDRYLNRVVPPPPWRLIPYPLAYFMGHRRGDPKPQGNLLIIFWAFIGAFCSLVLIRTVCHQIPEVSDYGPSLVASFGAAAVLEFYAIDAPFSQPRNCFFGQIIASIVGVSCCKLFALSSDFESIRWIGGALACASTIALMGLTKTIYPPAGATALLAVIDNSVTKIGWLLIPLIMLDCSIMLCMALILNNMQRRFPMYWWTPDDLRRNEAQQHDELSSLDEEKATNQQKEVVVARNGVVIPDSVILSSEEKILLERLRSRLLDS